MIHAGSVSNRVPFNVQTMLLAFVRTDELFRSMSTSGSKEALLMPVVLVGTCCAWDMLPYALLCNASRTGDGYETETTTERTGRLWEFHRYQINEVN